MLVNHFGAFNKNGIFNLKPQNLKDIDVRYWISKWWMKTIFAFLMLFSVNISAYGYVLEGPHLLELMTRKMGTSKHLRVTQDVLIYYSGFSAMQAQLRETLLYEFSKKFRSDLTSGDSKRIYLEAHGQSVAVLDGRRLKASVSIYDVYKDLLLHRSRKSLYKNLLYHGVDVSVSSIGRYNDRVAYILGAQYPNENVPQVWIDKETFLPFRWLIIRKGNKAFEHQEQLEILYSDWRKTRNIQYPKIIELFQNGQRIREIHVEQVQVDPNLPEELLDIQYLTSIYPIVAGDDIEAESPMQDDLNEFRQSLDEFKKKFEQ